LNDYLLSILLGIIEGLTEYLPISSTAHLRIVQQAFGIDLSDGYWKMYAIVIQLGAILCLPIYFRQRIRDFMISFPRGKRGDRTWLTHPFTLVLLSFAFTAVPSVLMKLYAMPARGSGAAAAEHHRLPAAVDAGHAGDRDHPCEVSGRRHPQPSARHGREHGAADP
jgi:hypothetical protein